MTVKPNPEPNHRTVSQRKIAVGVGLAVIVLVLFGSPLYDFLRGYAEGESTDLHAILNEHETPKFIGQIRFTYDDFGALNTDTMQTNALPWKVVTAALWLDQADEASGPINVEALNNLLSEFGFIQPNSIRNWKGDIPPRPFNRPLGIITAYVERKLPAFRIEVSNLGCSSCHAGVTYDAEGLPTKDVWLGLPNTSLNLEAYTQAVYRGLKRTIRNPEELLRRVKQIYPEIDSLEYDSLEKYVLPRIRKKLLQIQPTYDAPAPFGNGSPGATNGVASLKFQLGLIGDTYAESEVGYTSIPDLGGTIMRSALLYDGAYTVPGEKRFRPLQQSDVSASHREALARIAAFFLVPIMGIPAADAMNAIPRMVDVMTFIESYSPPPFPGRIDRDWARKGAQIYKAQCAKCHGYYSDGITDLKLLSLSNRWVSQQEINTDPTRWQVLDRQLASEIQTSVFRRHVSATQTQGYVSKPLSGLWATAPYLHNGSVPTLWHLMNPDKRPARFYVGGHRLDFQRVGISGQIDEDGLMSYPENYVPWSTPNLYDTTLPGQSNSGHDTEFLQLTNEEKKELIEYLKLQ